jgi:hypothetical protein
MSRDEIVDLIEQMESQVKSLRSTALKIAWNMRGGVSYEEAILMSSSEREMIIKLINENMEITKKSGLPYF